MRFLFVGEGSGYYESDDIDSSKTRERSKISSKLLKKTVNGFEYALYGSKKVEPIFEDNSPIGKLQGFTVTTSDGSKYIFKQPIRSYLKVDYSINREKGVPVFADKSSSKYDNFWGNLFKGIMAVTEWAFKHMNPVAVVQDIYNFVFAPGKLEEKCDPDGKDNKKDKKEDYYYSYTVNMNPHATQWLLSEVQGADYVKIGNRDIGYNVKFTYTEPSIYRWRTPYARPGVRADEVPNFRSPRNAFTPEGCDSRMYQASFGVKEYVYLKSIETSTHRVNFELNNQERVDGKGWEVGTNSVIPILVQTTLGMKIESRKGVVSKSYNAYRYSYQSSSHKTYDYWDQEITWRPKYIYFNTPLPEKILNVLYQNKEISISGLEPAKSGNDYLAEKNNDIMDGKVDNFADFTIAANLDSRYTIVPNSFARTHGQESRFGLYRLTLQSNPTTTFISYLKESAKDSAANAVADTLVSIGENGDLIQYPYIDWSNFIFTNTANVDTMENQMRYLKKITYYRKAGNDTIKYKEYDFNYDYSLQPKTLNSYCKGRYPDADSVDQIVRSPDSVGVDICKTDTTSRSLYGKLTLRSITETGFQNGKKASLPPFKFSYNAPAATPTRISTKNGWIDYFQENKGEEDSASVYGADYFEGFKDVDATILASSNTTDEYGFWSNTANVENHKIDQSFADYGAAAWSLNKVVDPTGGNLEVEYERDRYGAGVDFSQDKRTVEFSEFNQCSKYGILSYQDNLCIKVGTLYWRDQCLGPRAAYWDHDKPDGATGDGFDYLDSLQIKAENRSHLFYNLMVQLKTKVKCGMFGWGRCTRHRNVAVIGDIPLIAELDQAAVGVAAAVEAVGLGVHDDAAIGPGAERVFAVSIGKVVIVAAVGVAALAAGAVDEHIGVADLTHGGGLEEAEVRSSHAVALEHIVHLGAGHGGVHGLVQLRAVAGGLIAAPVAVDLAVVVHEDGGVKGHDIAQGAVVAVVRPVDNGEGIALAVGTAGAQHHGLAAAGLVAGIVVIIFAGGRGGILHAAHIGGVEGIVVQGVVRADDDAVIGPVEGIIHGAGVQNVVIGAVARLVHIMGAQEIETVLAGVVRILPDMGLGVGVEIVNGNEGIALLPLLLQGGDGRLGIVDLQGHVAGGHLEGKGAAVLRNGHVFSLGIGRGYLVDGFVCGDGNGLPCRGLGLVSLHRMGRGYLVHLAVGGGSAQTDDGDQAEEHRQRQQHAEQSLGVLFHRMLSPFILAENLHNLR